MVDQGLKRTQGTLDPQTQAEIRSMLDECPEPRIQPLTWIEFSKRGHPAGDGVHRALSGLLHGRVVCGLGISTIGMKTGLR